MSVEPTTLLVVDDSTTIQKVFKIAFSRDHVEVLTASTLAEAVNYVDTRVPHVVVLDASLQGASGPQDFAPLTDKLAETPVLFLVGSHDQVDTEVFRKAGYQNFINKPFDPNEIKRTINILLNRDPYNSAITVDAPPQNDHEPKDFMPPPPPPPKLDFDNDATTHQSTVSETIAPPPPPPTTPVDRGEPPLVSEEKLEARLTQEDSFGAHMHDSTDSNLRSTHHQPPIDAELPAEVMQALKNRFEEFLHQEAPVILRKALEQYCSDHFESLAREIIISELRRLADERARLLVDQ